MLPIALETAISDKPSHSVYWETGGKSKTLNEYTKKKIVQTKCYFILVLTLCHARNFLAVMWPYHLAHSRHFGPKFGQYVRFSPRAQPRLKQAGVNCRHKWLCLCGGWDLGPKKAKKHLFSAYSYPNWSLPKGLRLLACIENGGRSGFPKSKWKYARRSLGTGNFLAKNIRAMIKQSRVFEISGQLINCPGYRSTSL